MAHWAVDQSGWLMMMMIIIMLSGGDSREPSVHELHSQVLFSDGSNIRGLSLSARIVFLTFRISSDY